MCNLTPTIEPVFWDRERNGPGGGRKEEMDVILAHLRIAGCADCNAEMRRVLDNYHADQAKGGDFPLDYRFIGFTLLSMGFLFGLVGKAGVQVGSIPPILAMLGIGCLMLHRFVRR